MRIAVVTPIPTPYRDPFWQVMSARKDIQLCVFYCADAKADRPWDTSWNRDYDWSVLPGSNLLAWISSSSSMYLNWSITTKLRSGNFDAVMVGGYNHPTMLLAIWICLQLGIPYFLMCESHLAKPRSRLRNAAKDRLVRWVVRHAAGSFPTGTLAQEYLEHYGANPKELERLPNAPDVAWFRSRTAHYRENYKKLRAALPFDEAPIILFAGRLIPKKCVDILLKAAAKIIASGSPLNLIIVGDGPEKARLIELSKELHIGSRTHFAGFVRPSSMTKWYAVSNLFALPSSETWGVVVAEALASGVPVVLSDQVGCAHDMVNSPSVGNIFEAFSVDKLVQVLITQLKTVSTPGIVAQAWQPIYESLLYTELADRAVIHISNCK